MCESLRSYRPDERVTIVRHLRRDAVDVPSQPCRSLGSCVRRTVSSPTVGISLCMAIMGSGTYWCRGVWHAHLAGSFEVTK